MKPTSLWTRIKEGTALSLPSALIASLCCLGPLVLIIFGLGTASTALAFGAQKPLFLTAGLSLLILSLYLNLKTKITNQCRTRKEKIRYVALTLFTTLLFWTLLYYFLIYILSPSLAPLVYKKFY